jgi:hypothetical protein
MDFRIGSTNLDPEHPIEDFESMVWTERFNAFGDFELTMKKSKKNLARYAPGDFIFNDGPTVMMLETRDTTEPNLIKYTGRSLEAFLKFRGNLSPGSQGERLTGTYKQLMRYFVNRYCIDATTAGVNKLPNLYLPTEDTSGTINQDIEVRRGTIYDIVKSLADAGGLGFAIERRAQSNGAYLLAFTTKSGANTSYNPDDSFYTEASEANGKLLNVKELESSANYKNHAYIVGAKEVHNYYPPGIPSTISGWAKRTLLVNATDIDTGTPSLDWSLLRLRGIEALAEYNNRYIRMVDAEVPPPTLGNLRTSTGYIVGQTVLIRKRDGGRTPMLVTEVVHSQDSEGYRSTPTFVDPSNL